MFTYFILYTGFGAATSSIAIVVKMSARITIFLQWQIVRRINTIIQNPRLVLYCCVEHDKFESAEKVPLVVKQTYLMFLKVYRREFIACGNFHFIFHRDENYYDRVCVCVKQCTCESNTLTFNCGYTCKNMHIKW